MRYEHRQSQVNDRKDTPPTIKRYTNPDQNVIHREQVKGLS